MASQVFSLFWRHRSDRRRLQVTLIQTGSFKLLLQEFFASQMSEVSSLLRETMI